MFDRTGIVAAHRLSAVRDAGPVPVTDQGRIVRAGTCEELISRDGHCARLVAARNLRGPAAGTRAAVQERT
ncbi:hypothetical protein GCM10010517_79870 [Streptosporangium fragile]|uniref:Uncharacterized protein n=1 Tax=Streptosporangium fragile TaxID=46186 RepID=A0ABN3WGN1_9ACTN